MENKFTAMAVSETRRKQLLLLARWCGRSFFPLPKCLCGFLDRA